MFYTPYPSFYTFHLYIQKRRKAFHSLKTSPRTPHRAFTWTTITFGCKDQVASSAFGTVAVGPKASLRSHYVSHLIYNHSMLQLIENVILSSI